MRWHKFYPRSVWDFSSIFKFTFLTQIYNQIHKNFTYYLLVPWSTMASKRAWCPAVKSANIPIKVLFQFHDPVSHQWQHCANFPISNLSVYENIANMDSLIGWFTPCDPIIPEVIVDPEVQLVCFGWQWPIAGFVNLFCEVKRKLMVSAWLRWLLNKIYLSLRTINLTSSLLTIKR